MPAEVRRDGHLVLHHRLNDGRPSRVGSFGSPPAISAPTRPPSDARTWCSPSGRGGSGRGEFARLLSGLFSSLSPRPPRSSGCGDPHRAARPERRLQRGKSRRSTFVRVAPVYLRSDECPQRARIRGKAPTTAPQEIEREDRRRSGYEAAGAGAGDAAFERAPRRSSVSERGIDAAPAAGRVLAGPCAEPFVQNDPRGAPGSTHEVRAVIASGGSPAS
jgi:hypothetical protein